MKEIFGGMRSASWWCIWT